MKYSACVDGDTIAIASATPDGQVFTHYAGPIARLVPLIEQPIIIRDSGFLHALNKIRNEKEHTNVTTTEPTLAELEAEREVEVQKRDKAHAKYQRHDKRVGELDELIEKANLPHEPRAKNAVVRIRYSSKRYGSSRPIAILSRRLDDGRWTHPASSQGKPWADVISFHRSRSVTGSITVHELIEWQQL